MDISFKFVGQNNLRLIEISSSRSCCAIWYCAAYFSLIHFSTSERNIIFSLEMIYLLLCCNISMSILDIISISSGNPCFISRKLIAAFICAAATSRTSHIAVFPRYGTWPSNILFINIELSPVNVVDLCGPTIKDGKIVVPITFLVLRSGSSNISQNLFSATVLLYR